MIARYQWLITAAGIAVILTICGCAPTGAVIDNSPLISPPPRGRTIEEGVEYVVRPGDTLYGIAQRYGLDWREVARANSSVLGGDPTALSPGMVLRLPVGPTTEPGARTPWQPRTQGASLRHSGHEGPLPAEANFIWPLQGRLLAGYGEPVVWQAGEPNQGIDIAPSSDPTVVAAKSGKVNIFQNVPGYGLAVVLEHADGSMSFYGHLDEVLVPHGRWVRQGEPLAVAGEDPFSNGIELHFRVIRNDAIVNPLLVLPR